MILINLVLFVCYYHFIWVQETFVISIFLVSFSNCCWLSIIHDMRKRNKRTEKTVVHFLIITSSLCWILLRLTFHPKHYIISGFLFILTPPLSSANLHTCSLSPNRFYPCPALLSCVLSMKKWKQRWINFAGFGQERIFIGNNCLNIVWFPASMVDLNFRNSFCLSNKFHSQANTHIFLHESANLGEKLPELSNFLKLSEN